jgi:hypothetical protein
MMQLMSLRDLITFGKQMLTIVVLFIVLIALLAVGAHLLK